MIRWILFILVLLVVEFYSFVAFRTIFRLKWAQIAYAVINAGVIVYIVYSFTQFDRSVGQNKQSLFTLGLLLLFIIPKLIITVVLLTEDLVRLIAGFAHLKSENNVGFFPQRRKFVSQAAIGLAAIPFLSLIYGMTKGKYNFKVIKQTLFFPDLPDAFEGLTITQISDIHSGSFDDLEKIEYAVNLVNEQNSDLLVFTGDIVNSHADEMTPWLTTFKKLVTPKYGKYSILGNHDYGEYISWSSQADKDANFQNIKDIHSKIDFKLLLNEHIKIKNDESEIAIVGVENWGHNFKKAGDLNLASQGLTAEDFKILLSHDPSHWEYEIKTSEKNYQLTLSGHTHGLQFGIEIPGIIKWSPVQYVYKQWAGLYDFAGRYLYVNRGFGFHAYPGRVGIWPEITVLELKKGKKMV